jgi:predicted transcriptional regulator
MDWKSIMSAIIESGLTQVQVAERLGRSQAWVSAVLQGKYQDVRWADGNAVLALHAEISATRKAA